MLSFENVEFGKIFVGDQEFPLFCDMHVLHLVQDAGYTIAEFEQKLMGWERVTGEDGTKTLRMINDPDMSVVMLAMELMLMEGMTVYNLLHPEEQKYKNPERDAAMLVVMYRGSPYTAAMTLHAEWYKCFDDGKKKEGITTIPTRTTKVKATRKKQTSMNSNTSP